MLIGLGIHLDLCILAPAYFNHLGAIANWNKKNDIILIGVQRMKVAAARRKITENAVRQNCDYLLFLDSDHIVPDNMLDLLLENKDAAMVSALICKRSLPYNTVGFKLDSNDELQEVLLHEDTGVVELDGCAMGCTLINMKLLKELKAPLWQDNHFRSDINLCLKFRRELDAKILIDTRVSVGHMRNPQAVYPNNAESLCQKDVERMVLDVK